MTHLLKTNSILLLLLLAIVAPSFAQFRNLALDNRQSILNERAFLSFPAAAKNVMRPVDIMEANPSEDTETRIVMDIDSMRIVFFARERYERSGRQFLEAVREKDQADFKVTRLKQTDSLDVLLETPLTYDSTESAIAIGRLLIKAADNTLFDITAYINPPAFRFKNDFQELATNIFQTITVGKRRLALQKRAEAVTAYDKKKQLIFALPADYVISKTVSYDFDVIRIEKVRDLSDTTWSGITIYSGGYPSYFYPDYEFKTKDAQKIKGKFLDQSFEWLAFYKSNPPVFLREVQLPGDAIQQNLVLHLALLANTREGMEEQLKIIEAVQLR